MQTLERTNRYATPLNHQPAYPPAHRFLGFLHLDSPPKYTVTILRAGSGSWAILLAMMKLDPRMFTSEKWEVGGDRWT